VRADEGETVALDESAQSAEIDTRPWSQGVPEDRKVEAQRLLEEGNASFLRNDHKAALLSYQKALESWDHPAIRFNLARTLIQLDRPVEAYENLEQALRYGASALEEHVYVEAQGYLRLLQRQVGELELSCAQNGVQVAVDGQTLLSCPGTRRVRLAPGTHLVVGSAQGLLTQTKSVLMLPGGSQELELKLVSLNEATRTERRWALWKPWAVVGGGAALLGMAGLLRWQAKANYREYGEDVSRVCAEHPCSDHDLPRTTRELDTRAGREDKSAIAVGVLGIATCAAGLTLVLFNQAHPVLPKQEPTRPTVAPVISAHGVTATVSGQF
jgi:tetratricopeptide (TPR) repeat protein